MKSLVLITFETPEHPVDARIAGTIGSEYARRREDGAAPVRLDCVRVCVSGERRRPDASGDVIEWGIAANADGTVPDEETLLLDARSLATYLHFRLHTLPGLTACNIIFAAHSPQPSVAALQAGACVVRMLQEYMPVHAQMAILQSQLAMNDAPTRALMGAIRSYNEAKNYVYDNLYLLPWDDGVTQENTLGTLRALAAACAMEGSEAIMLGTGNGDANMIKTAAVTGLRPPARQISDLIYSQLADWLVEASFDADREKSAGEGAFAGGEELKRGVEEIGRMLDDFERGYRLPELKELYMIMPLRDPEPKDIPGEKESLSAAAAWKYIERLYGEKTAGEILARLQRDPQTLERYYAGTCRAVAQKIAECALETARKKRLNLHELPQLVERILTNALKGLKTRGEPEAEPLRYGKALMGDRRRAIAVAQARHRCLNAVYAEARARAGAEKSDVSSRLLRDAADQARVFLQDSLMQLEKSFYLLNKRHQFASAAGDCYLEGLRDAYQNYWCRQNIPAEERFGVNAIYDLYDPAGYRPLFERAAAPEEIAAYAERLAGKLEGAIERRVETLLGGIRSSIDGFFAELSFRAELLKKQNDQTDLIGGVLDYLEKSLARSPLMKIVEPGGDSLPPVEKVFIVRDDAEVDDLQSRIAKLDNASILRDVYSDGVQLFVKYAGCALDKLTVYINNRNA